MIGSAFKDPITKLIAMAFLIPITGFLMFYLFMLRFHPRWVEEDVSKFVGYQAGVVLDAFRSPNGSDVLHGRDNFGLTLIPSKVNYTTWQQRIQLCAVALQKVFSSN